MGLFRRKSTQNRQSNASAITSSVIKQVSAFMDASLLLVPLDSVLSGSRREQIIFAYTFGAIDALGHKNSLDHVQTLAVAALFFREYLRLSDEQSGATAGFCAKSTTNPEFLHWMEVGGRACLAWLSGEDRNAPLRLAELATLPTDNSEVQ